MFSSIRSKSSRQTRTTRCTKHVSQERSLSADNPLKPGRTAGCSKNHTVAEDDATTMTSTDVSTMSGSSYSTSPSLKSSTPPFCPEDIYRVDVGATKSVGASGARNAMANEAPTPRVVSIAATRKLDRLPSDWSSIPSIKHEHSEFWGRRMSYDCGKSDDDASNCNNTEEPEEADDATDRELQMGKSFSIYSTDSTDASFSSTQHYLYRPNTNAAGILNQGREDNSFPLTLVEEGSGQSDSFESLVKNSMNALSKEQEDYRDGTIHNHEQSFDEAVKRAAIQFYDAVVARIGGQ